MSAPIRTVYILAKYSQASPSKKQSGRGIELDWQHHTEPVLRLLLEIRQTHAGTVESARMRVVQTRTAGDNVAATHENTVLEDIDFVTVQKQNTQLAMQGVIPLKAVYREGMLGIRYFHRVSNALPPAQRRFQVTFLSEENTAEVIAAIKSVCPVKRSGSSVQYSQFESQVDNSSALDLPVPVVTASNPSGPSFITTSRGSMNPPLQMSTTLRPPAPASNPSRFSSVRVSMGAAAVRVGSINSSAQQGAFSAATTCNSVTHGSSTAENSVSPIKEFPVPRSSQQTSNDQSDLVGPQSALHDESLSTLSRTAPAQPPSSDDFLPPPSAIPSSDKDSSATVALPLDDTVLSSAVESLTSAKLTSQELEALIAQIIHEDSFAELLEAIDNLWRLKALLP